MASKSECLIPGLPNHIAVICLAKVPLLYRHCISSVCRRWRNLFHDEQFWNVRRECSARETLLLVWSQNHYKIGAWYGFYPGTNGWIRLPLMPMDKRLKGSSAVAVVDEKLFVIGGWILSALHPPPKSSKVSYFDLKRWEWKETAPLNLGRFRLMAGAINGLLYVFGGLIDGQGIHRLEETSTVEVYDPVTTTWKFVSSMNVPMNLVSSIVVDGKFYAVNSGCATDHLSFTGVVYCPREDQWTQMGEDLNSEWSNQPVEYDGLMCISRDSFNLRETCILGYDPSENTWKLIHGQRAIENEFHPLRMPTKIAKRRQLLSLDGRLYYLTRGLRGKAIVFEIKDLTGRSLASKSFRRCENAGTDLEPSVPDGLESVQLEVDLDSVQLVEHKVVIL